MKNYCFEGFLAEGTGKVHSLYSWSEDNACSLLSSCPRDFYYKIHFFPQLETAKGLFRIFVNDCQSLADSLTSLKLLLSEQKIDLYISPKYSCASPCSGTVKNSIRYFRDNFDFDSV